MKKHLAIWTLFTFTTAFADNVKADTIDFWHVYYNKTKIREYHQFSGQQTIILKLDSIKNGDTLTVKYFRDTPCSNCTTHLRIEDANQIFVTDAMGIGTLNPISFRLNQLIVFKYKSGIDTFFLYYYEGENKTEKILLFKIKLE